MPVKPPRRRHTGAVAVEAAFTAILLLGLLVTASDVGLLLSRRALLLDAVSQTLREASRRPDWAVHGVNLHESIRELFQSNLQRIVGTTPPEVKIATLHVACEHGADGEGDEIRVDLEAEWRFSCATCWWFRHFDAFRARGFEILESPTDELVFDECGSGIA